MPLKAMILSAHQTPSHPQPRLPSAASRRSLRRPSPQQKQQQQQQQQPPAPLLLRFKTDYQEKLQYLVRVGVVPTISITPSRPSLDRILHLIHFLKASGISDSHLPKLAASCPQLFTSGLDPEDISPVFLFLTSELGASLDDAAGLVLRCPHLLLSSVQHRLRPTLLFLRGIRVEKLTVPNHLNAHLLNTRVDRLVEKIEWLVEIGFERAEAEAACARMRALFGYSIRNCMIPKYDYLVGEMGRGVDEVKAFPQYFGFSLVNRIVPRHLHLKQRGIRVSLRDLLVCADDKFYQRWI